MDKEKKDFLGILLLAGSGVAVALAAVAHVLLKPPAYDSETLCLEEEKENRRVSLIIDKTDHFENTSRLRAIVEGSREELRIHDRLVIFVMEGDGTIPQYPVFDLCNPGNSGDVSPIYRNPRKVGQFFNKEFGDPLNSILADLLVQSVAPQSPISQTFARAVNYDNYSGFPESHKIVLVSDLFENSPIGSTYGSIASVSPDNFMELLPDSEAFGGSLEVVMEVVWRSNRDRQKWVVENYWKRGLEKLGANVTVRNFPRY